ncbi:MAG: DUF2752 domain-containing protein [Bacteroidales bacterium]|nr:DUF2752 domain-containing protein [Candidatus Colimorpha onthohippi]
MQNKVFNHYSPILRYSAVLVCAALYVISDIKNIVRCPFRTLTGIPCPGCGGTRAALLLMQGKVGDALLTNPLSVIAIVAVAVGWVWCLIDCIRGTSSLRKFMTEPWPKKVIYPILLVIIVNWIWNISKWM